MSHVIGLKGPCNWISLTLCFLSLLIMHVIRLWLMVFNLPKKTGSPCLFHPSNILLVTYLTTSYQPSPFMPPSSILCMITNNSCWNNFFFAKMGLNNSILIISEFQQYNLKLIMFSYILTVAQCLRLLYMCNWVQTRYNMSQ